MRGTQSPKQKEGQKQTAEHPQLLLRSSTYLNRQAGILKGLRASRTASEKTVWAAQHARHFREYLLTTSHESTVTRSRSSAPPLSTLTVTRILLGKQSRKKLPLWTKTSLDPALLTASGSLHCQPGKGAHLTPTLTGVQQGKAVCLPVLAKVRANCRDFSPRSQQAALRQELCSQPRNTIDTVSF